ncbi:MAG: nascent polypeptide-associated complex protein [Thermoplasmata archaeon]
MRVISMLPGIPGGRVNPRQAKVLMKQLGYREMEDVEEVIIRTSTKEYIIRRAGVAEMTVQGQKIFQVVGEAEVVEREGAGPTIPEEDVMLVVERAGVSPEEARKALEECGGEPAEAIIRLMKK